MSASFDAIVAGHVCLDLTPDLSGMTAGEFTAMFRPGRLLDAGPVTVGGGGAVANAGLGLAALGVPTLLMGKIGTDVFGEVLQRVLTAGHGDASGLIVDPASHTSYSVVINPAGIDRIILHYPGANDTFEAGDIRYDLLGRARIFHFGYPTIMQRIYRDGGRQLVEIFRRARGTGVTTSLDMSLPDPKSGPGRADWRAILVATLPYVDVFLPSAEEILLMLRAPLYHDWLARAGAGGDLLPFFTPELLSELAGELLAMGARIVGLKLGLRGFYLKTGAAAALAQAGRAAPADPAAWAGRELWAPAFRVHEVTATGSGDCAIAGFLSGLLHGLSVEETLIAACAVGASNVEAADSVSGLRTWEATLARLAGPWPRHDFEIDAPGWSCDPATGLWQRR